MHLQCDIPISCAEPPCGDPRREDSCKSLNEYTKVLRNVCRRYYDAEDNPADCDNIGYQGFLEEYN